MPDYERYRFCAKEGLGCFVKGMLLEILFAYVFYRSVIAAILLIPIAVLYTKKKENDVKKDRKQELGMQFGEMMRSVNGSLQAGYSVENAFIHARSDMVLLYGKEAMIVKELDYFTKGMRNNQNLEHLLKDFGERSHISDIKDFATVFQIAKRTGGDLPGMLASSSDMIRQKMEVKRKIATVISAKKYEQGIMNLVPFGIILYIDASSPGFFDVLYHNLTGILIMSILMIIYFIAYFISEKIMKINI